MASSRAVLPNSRLLGSVDAEVSHTPQPMQRSRVRDNHTGPSRSGSSFFFDNAPATGRPPGKSNRQTRRNSDRDRFTAIVFGALFAARPHLRQP